ncbi:hypothetical protein GCM10023187_47440 [Nibrella viscosa]|uniref:DinB-like domain-containing protein n=1 Tax=Nibrella viscosa TaxID=1084524 RepID=A0ABP8KU94_9BACT
MQEVSLLSDMTDFQYKSLWGNLKGITEKEADWKPNAESNSIRWVVGHLCWFEEWMSKRIVPTWPATSIRSGTFGVPTAACFTSPVKPILTPGKMKVSTDAVFYGTDPNVGAMPKP